MILDIIVIGILLLSFIIGSKRGLIKSLQGIFGWVFTGIVVFVLLNPAVEYLSQTGIAVWVNDYISQNITLPENIVMMINAGGGDFATLLTGAVIKIISLCLLIILSKLLIWIVFSVLDIAAKLPFLNQTNKLLGGVLSLVSTVLFMYLVCAVLSVTASPSIYEYINSTRIVKFLFENNVLLGLFM